MEVEPTPDQLKGQGISQLKDFLERGGYLNVLGEEVDIAKLNLNSHSIRPYQFVPNFLAGLIAFRPYGSLQDKYRPAHPTKTSSQFLRGEINALANFLAKRYAEFGLELETVNPRQDVLVLFARNAKKK